jgi:hypothetical protein
MCLLRGITEHKTLRRKLENSKPVIEGTNE